MTYRPVIVVLLTLLLLCTQVMAQENDVSPTFDIDDIVTISLEPDETASYQIDLEPAQSVVLATDGDIDHGITVENARGETAYLRDVDADNHRFVARLVRAMTGPFASDGPFTIHIANRDDIAGEVAVSITETEAYRIELGTTYLFDEMHPRIFELVFEAEAGQAITLQSSALDIQYFVEQITDEGVAWSLAWVFSDFEQTTGIEVAETGMYRVVVNVQIWPDEEPLAGSVLVRETETVTGAVAVGESVTGQVTTSRFAYQIDLERLQGVRVTFESEGAQTAIRDDEGNILAYFGHAAVPHERTQMGLIAPETGTYTIHAFHPEMGDLFDGKFTLTVEPMAVTPLADEPVMVHLTREESQFIIVEVEAGTTYQLTLDNPDDAEGGVRVRVYALDGETLLLEESAKAIAATYTFTAENDGYTGIELIGLNSIDAPVEVALEVIGQPE